MDANAFIDKRAVAVILAAGLSRRMGRPKQVLAFEHSTLLETAVNHARLAGCVPLVVLPPSLTDWELPPETFRVENPRPEAGMASSVKLGVQTARARWPGLAVMVLLGDQPFVTPEHMLPVIDAFEKREAGIHVVRPRYDGNPGHPVMFDETLDPEINRLEGDRGLSAVLRNRDDVALLEVLVSDGLDPAFDVDTQADYHVARLRAHERSIRHGGL